LGLVGIFSFALHIHIHKITRSTWVYAVLVEENTDATPKQPLKINLKQKSNPKHKPTCENPKTKNTTQRPKSQKS
jgi:hypothetical protein